MENTTRVAESALQFQCLVRKFDRVYEKSKLKLVVVKSKDMGGE